MKLFIIFSLLFLTSCITDKSSCDRKIKEFFPDKEIIPIPRLVGPSGYAYYIENYAIVTCFTNPVEEDLFVTPFVIKEKQTEKATKEEPTLCSKVVETLNKIDDDIKELEPGKCLYGAFCLTKDNWYGAGIMGVIITNVACEGDKE